MHIGRNIELEMVRNGWAWVLELTVPMIDTSKRLNSLGSTKKE
jgi:endonuclease YncB( thermonuclease family)